MASVMRTRPSTGAAMATCHCSSVPMQRTSWRTNGRRQEYSGLARALTDAPPLARRLLCSGSRSRRWPFPRPQLPRCSRSPVEQLPLQLARARSAGTVQSHVWNGPLKTGAALTVGIPEMLIIRTPDDTPCFQHLLGDGTACLAWEMPPDGERMAAACLP